MSPRDRMEEFPGENLCLRGGKLFFNGCEELGRIQDLTKGGSDKRPPKAVAPRGVGGHAPPENF